MGLLNGFAKQRKVKAMAELFHPGEYIREELDARGWTIDDLVSASSFSRLLLEQLIDGRGSITPRVAADIARAFGQSPETWLNLQKAYDRAKGESDETKNANRTQSH